MNIFSLIIFCFLLVQCEFNSFIKGKNEQLKNRKRKLLTCQEIFEQEDSFQPLNVYLDEICFEKEIENTIINPYRDKIYNSINNAAKELGKIIKINMNCASPTYGNEEITQELGINFWNDQIIGDNVGDFTESMFTKGYGYIIYTKVAEINTMGNKIASSQIILNDGGCGQPIIGIITLNPDINYSIYPESYLKIIMLHHIIHLLGFHKNFSLSSEENDAPFEGLLKEEPINSNHYYVDSSKVINYAKNYFDCSSITKIDMEIIDDMPHWPSRIILGDIMSDLLYPEEFVISGFTLSFLEDLGYIRVSNHYTGGLMRFGKHKGCEFLYNKCIGDTDSDGENIKFENDFYYPTQFNLLNFEQSCSSGRTSRTVHKIYSYGSDISPSNYQYFTENKNIGGPKEVNYCPISQYDSYDIEHIYDGHCSSKGKLSNIASIIGEVLSDNSFCVLSSLIKKTITNYQTYSNQVRAVCLQMHCSSQSLTIQIGEDFLVCPNEGGKITGEGFAGYLLCPDFNLICTVKEEKLCNDIFGCIDNESEEKEFPIVYSYDTIETSQDSSFYLTQGISNGEIWEKSNINNKCPQYCIQCKIGNQCIKCKSDYDLLGSEDNDEVICELKTILAHGHYRKSSNKVYYPCIEHCDECDNGTTCKKCYVNYKIEGNICVPKVENCEEYNEDESCKKCIDGYGLLKGEETTCKILSELENNFYFSKTDAEGNTYYIKCSYQIENCIECNSENNCLSCKTNFAIVNDIHNKCEDLSTNKYYLDSGDGKYKLCSNGLEGCEICTNIDDNFICHQCDSSYAAFYDGTQIQCLSRVSINENNNLFSNDGLTYYSCSDNRYHSVNNCLNCQNKLSCDMCQAGYILGNSNKLCVSNDALLNKKYYKDARNNNYYLCSQKIQGCDRCESGNACIECNSDYQLDENDKCFYSSLIGTKYYLDPNTGKYASCTKIANCQECISSTGCTKCQNGYILNNDLCEKINEKNNDNSKSLAICAIVLSVISSLIAIAAIILVLLKKGFFKGNNRKMLTEEKNINNEENDEVVVHSKKRSIHNEVKNGE